MLAEVAPLQVRRTVFIPPTLRPLALSVIVGEPDCAQYLPPVLLVVFPPQTIISLSVHTAVWPDRARGALVVLVGVQVSMLGLYLPPVLSLVPPQTIISLSVQTAVCPVRSVGALVVLVAVQLFVPGLYLPPVFKGPRY